MLHPTDEYITLKPGMCSTAIVLAGGIRSDDTLPPEVMSRCDVAIDLYATGVITTILCSGGDVGNACTEAEAMKAYISSHGVPKNRVKTETQSRDTIGNAIFTKPMLKENLFILITSDYHLSRAKALFTHIYGEGYHVIGVASESSPMHRFRRFFHDDALHIVESTILTTVKKGDHAHAEKLMRKLIDRY